uniref:Uncharacterized protein n=1 Tax=Mantoniella antarctica TaxID=81844 RepID=A0A7S0XHS5_9CHLO
MATALRNVAWRLRLTAMASTPDGARHISGNDLSRKVFGGTGIARVSEEEYIRTEGDGHLKQRRLAMEAIVEAEREAERATILEAKMEAERQLSLYSRLSRFGRGVTEIEITDDMLKAGFVGTAFLATTSAITFA